MGDLLSNYAFIVAITLIVSSFIRQSERYVSRLRCDDPRTRCYGEYIRCPLECPYPSIDIPSIPKVSYVDCDSPLCQAQYISRKASCDTPGSACHDPRFIDADGVVFYFHGKSNQLSLVSDFTLQINARFTGHRPQGRTRDFTWIQALGILYRSQTFSLEATKAATWDPEVDHLKFSYDGDNLTIPEGSLSTWSSSKKDVKIERASSKNSVIITLKDKAEIRVNVVPVTKEDDKVHKYQVPKDDCFVHLEVQFKFYNLSPKVDGVLGRTYRPDFKNPAKPGVAMPILGGEDKYKTASLFATECNACIFSPENDSTNFGSSSVIDFGSLDCTRGVSAGYGIVCRK